MNWLARWRRRGADAQAADDAARSRWIVLDVESTGLDPHRDRLLAIAAVAVHWEGGTLRPRIAAGDSFAAVLRPPDAGPQAPDATPARHATGPLAAAGAAATPPDRANILLHGIGLAAQRAGAEPAAVHRAFDDWCGGAPRLGYHVAFDRALIERSRRAALGAPSPSPAPRWLDLEPLAAVAGARLAAADGASGAVSRTAGTAARLPTERPLDHWLDRFGIRCLARHDAAADALATAELLLALWPRLLLETGPMRDAAAAFGALGRVAAARRWLPR